jgi:hypothetical protein
MNVAGNKCKGIKIDKETLFAYGNVKQFTRGYEKSPCCTTLFDLLCQIFGINVMNITGIIILSVVPF